MPIYMAVPLQETSSTLDAAVEKYIINPADRYKLQSERGWLIKYEGTTVELSNFLTITGQAHQEPAPIGPVIIVPVTGYFGRGPTDMWEWLKTRFEA